VQDSSWEDALTIAHQTSSDMSSPQSKVPRGRWQLLYQIPPGLLSSESQGKTDVFVYDGARQTLGGVAFSDNPSWRCVNEFTPPRCITFTMNTY
jgi:hypothetical protein